MFAILGLIVYLAVNLLVAWVAVKFAEAAKMPEWLVVVVGIAAFWCWPVALVVWLVALVVKPGAAKGK